MPEIDFKREHWEPEPPLTVSQWADKNRVLTSLAGDAEPGPWVTDRTPYLREIMDSLSDPDVEEVTLQKATQVGGTQAALNFIGYAVEHDPSPTMVVLPRDEDAKAWGAKRVKTMVQSSPALLQETTGKEDDLAGKLFKFRRMWVKLAGANSPADLSSDPIRFVIFDETDKYPPFSGREADPIKLGGERTRTFPYTKKLFKLSTPTTSRGYIARDYQRSDKRRFNVPCPHCGTYQPLAFSAEYGPGGGEIVWPDGAESIEIKAQRLAKYKCGHCHELIPESCKLSMLAKGVWCPEGCTVDLHGTVHGESRNARHRGYHLSALYSPWVSWSDIAAEFLDTKDVPSEFMNFVNSMLAEVWREKVKKTTEDYLRSRREPYPMGVAPAGTLVLTAGIDVQEGYFVYVLRGWGFYERSWLVRYGRAETKEELLHVLFATQYEVRGAQPLMVRLACIDSGYKTDDVYALCRQRLEVLRPVKGQQQLSGMPYRASLIDKDARGRSIPGGLTLWHLNTTYYKDKLNRLIHSEPGASSEWSLPEDIADESEYFRQMTAEHKVLVKDKRSGRIDEEWQLVSDGRANHYWDCETYNVAAADMLKVYLLRPAGSVETYRPKSSTGWLRRDGGGRERPGGGGWMKR
ncbi:terminase gpA endonuclease subunit [Candidatus Nitrospira bockiana]